MQGRQQDRLAHNIYRQRRLCTPCAVCAKGIDSSFHDRLLAQFHWNMEQTTCAKPNAILIHSLKSTLSRRKAVCNNGHRLSTNCYQFIGPGAMNDLVGRCATPELNPDCRIVYPTR